MHSQGKLSLVTCARRERLSLLAPRLRVMRAGACPRFVVFFDSHSLWRIRTWRRRVASRPRRRRRRRRRRRGRWARLRPRRLRRRWRRRRPSAGTRTPTSPARRETAGTRLQHLLGTKKHVAWERRPAQCCSPHCVHRTTRSLRNYRATPRRCSHARGGWTSHHPPNSPRHLMPLSRLPLPLHPPCRVYLPQVPHRVPLLQLSRRGWPRPCARRRPTSTSARPLQQQRPLTPSPHQHEVLLRGRRRRLRITHSSPAPHGAKTPRGLQPGWHSGICPRSTPSRRRRRESCSARISFPFPTLPPPPAAPSDHPRRRLGHRRSRHARR